MISAPTQEPGSVLHILRRIQSDVETIRGSAYPEQISDHILEIAGRHDSWFRSRLHASVRDLVDAVWANVPEALANTKAIVTFHVECLQEEEEPFPTEKGVE